jgi:hypothetical protein
MIDPRALFRRNVTKVAADARQASADLVRRLKRMPPGEFLKQPASVFDHLTPAQYREIVGAIAPGVKLVQPAIENPAAEKPTLLEWWRERSVGMRSFLLTASFTVLFATLGALAPSAFKWTLSQTDIVRSRATDTWPACSRLSPTTDGCIYTPTQDLNWDGVAQQLNMPVETLRKANRHLPPQFIVRRAPLIVWRERGRLEN